MKVKVEGRNYRAINLSVVHLWNRAVRGDLTNADLEFFANRIASVPTTMEDGVGSTLVLTASKVMN